MTMNLQQIYSLAISENHNNDLISILTEELFITLNNYKTQVITNDEDIDNRGNINVSVCSFQHESKDYLIQKIAVLLQSGADMYRFVGKSSQSAYMIMSSMKEMSKIWELFEKYKPGLWRAVERKDLLLVRKCINLWMNTNLFQNGKSLLQLATESGTQDIIHLIRHIEPSMKMVYSILSNDVTLVKSLLERYEISKLNDHTVNSIATPPKVNLEFRNMGDMGRTVLYYAIINENVEIVRLLLHYGANPYAKLILNEEDEIPLLFYVIHVTSLEVLRILLHHCSEFVTSEISTFDRTKELYHGYTLLSYSIETGVKMDIFKELLKFTVCRRMLPIRTSLSETIFNQCTRLGHGEFLREIENLILTWINHTVSHIDRVVNNDELCNMNIQEEFEDQTDFISEILVLLIQTSAFSARIVNHEYFLPWRESFFKYRRAVENLHLAVHSNKISPEEWSRLCYFVDDSVSVPDSFDNLLKFYSLSSECLIISLSLFHCQTILHAAVLNENIAFIEYLVQLILGYNNICDNMRDSYGRTPLHYAQILMTSSEEKNVICGLLLDAGFSDNVSDNNDHTPRDFAGASSFCSRETLQAFLSFHRKKCSMNSWNNNFIDAHNTCDSDLRDFLQMHENYIDKYQSFSRCDGDNKMMTSQSEWLEDEEPDIFDICHRIPPIIQEMHNKYDGDAKKMLSEFQANHSSYDGDAHQTYKMVLHNNHVGDTSTSNESLESCYQSEFIKDSRQDVSLMREKNHATIHFHSYYQRIDMTNDKDDHDSQIGTSSIDTDNNQKITFVKNVPNSIKETLLYEDISFGQDSECEYDNNFDETYRNNEKKDYSYIDSFCSIL